MLSDNGGDSRTQSVSMRQGSGLKGTRVRGISINVDRQDDIFGEPVSARVRGLLHVWFLLLIAPAASALDGAASGADPAESGDQAAAARRPWRQVSQSHAVETNFCPHTSTVGMWPVLAAL
jgi:hypothetical protein